MRPHRHAPTNTMVSLQSPAPLPPRPAPAPPPPTTCTTHSPLPSPVPTAPRQWVHPDGVPAPACHLERTVEEVGAGVGSEAAHLAELDASHIATHEPVRHARGVVHAEAARATRGHTHTRARRVSELPGRGAVCLAGGVVDVGQGKVRRVCRREGNSNRDSISNSTSTSNS